MEEFKILNFCNECDYFVETYAERDTGYSEGYCDFDVNGIIEKSKCPCVLDITVKIEVDYDY